MLPEEVCTDEFFKKRREEEQKTINKICDEFKATQKIFYPLRDSEVSGLELLESVGDFLFEGKKQISQLELADAKPAKSLQVMRHQEKQNMRIICSGQSMEQNTFSLQAKAGSGKAQLPAQLLYT